MKIINIIKFNKKIMNLIFLIIWIVIGLWVGVKYGDLWTMCITLPICIIFGPFSWIYYKIKEKI